MPDSFAGITVPEGEPDGLRAGAERLAGAADRLGAARDDLAALPGAMGGWAGEASLAYRGATLTNGVGAEAAIEAVIACAAATRIYADALDDAQRRAERAIADARAAQDRIDAARRAIDDATGRAVDANRRIAAAEFARLGNGVLAPFDPGAEAEARAARDDRAAAEADAAAGRRRGGAAADALEGARRRGREAMEDAEEAGREAGRAFSAAGIAAPVTARPGSPATASVSGLPLPRHPLAGRGGTPAADDPVLTDAERERLRFIDDARRERDDELRPPDEGGGVMGWIHGGLDGAGFLPGAGAVPDVLNAGLYAVQGKGEEAAWSMGAAVPFAGDAAKAGKMTKEAVEQGAGHADEAAGAAGSARRTWRESEDEVGRRLEGQGYDSQRSFKDGEEVPYGTPGSTRPDWYRPGDAIEVKNYKVADAAGRDRLVTNVADQAIERARHLPPGTPQRAMIDVKGQDVPDEVLIALGERIAHRSGGALPIERILFITD